ncbi:MAG: biotin-dependent carboxyltransferase family protein [Candidatus Dormibacterales bacterium]
MTEQSPAAEVFSVLSAGLLTTVQDLGRPGRRTAGVTPGGAMDQFAAMAANRLAGNPPGSPLLECTVRGPVLAALRPCVVAVTGGDLGLHLGGAEAPLWEAFQVREGDALAFEGRRTGARAYLAVAGGLAARRWLGSASTDLLVGKGGHEGRPLAEGDVLSAGPAPPWCDPRRGLGPRLRPAYAARPDLCAVPGPHLGHLDPRSRDALFGGPFRLGADANRVGYRLEGEAPLVMAGTGALLSFGVCAGCVQVPASGRPILLMADHHTSGGYPVAACVARCSLPEAAQLVPGDTLSLKPVDPQEAQARWRLLLAALEEI